jgi:hypothetical protein
MVHSRRRIQLPKQAMTNSVNIHFRANTCQGLLPLHPERKKLLQPPYIKLGLTTRFVKAMNQNVGGFS